MTTSQLLEQIKKSDVKKIGRSPFVVLPLSVWEKIQDYVEDLEIENSRHLAKKISKARTEKRLYSASEIKKLAVSS